MGFDLPSVFVLCGVVFGESCVWCGMSEYVFNCGVSVVSFGICYVM